MLMRVAMLVIVGLGLASCQEGGNYGRSARAYVPVPPATLALMSEKGMTKSAPILIRAYKKEAELEIWKKDNSGRYALLKSYPICRWSGQLGPKVREGDRQAPEGFYTITPAQMNPNSNYFLSFDTGFPNAYDRANGFTGSFLMVHGACSSRGCYSMTDEQIAEIYAVAREAFAGGQRSFQFQAFPFRMTPENLAKHRKDPNIAFWRMLKRGSDYFEVTREEPKVGVCGRRYVFNAVSANGLRLDPVATCPPLREEEAVAAAVNAKERQDEAKVAELVREGVPAIRLVYQDGGQNPKFRTASSSADDGSGRAMMFASARPAKQLEVSRPEALEAGPQEIVLDDGGRAAAPATAVAAVQPAAGAALNSAPVTQAIKAEEAPAPILASAAAGPGEKPSLLRRVFSWSEASKPAATGGTAAAPTAVPLPPQRGSAGADQRAELAARPQPTPETAPAQAAPKRIWPLSMF
ncbi:L,D-transpeptidase family protein [Chelatococcus sp. GCM10030263]|uniref:L,D-transpeptidase family protein n=1 Tax=Chelatococcus sp. GCM10030263 TaxID=3273387 RepID=UPI003611483B